jgi:hypothetical protein
MARENFRGERSRPIGGIKGASPEVRPRQRLPKQSRGAGAGNGSDLEKQSAIYLRERNAAMKLKRQTAEIELARTRDELIEKALVERQLAYVLIPFRQAVAAIPSRLRRALGDRFDHEMVQTARRIAHETLGMLSRLPEAIEPGWEERLDEEEK